MKKLSSIYLAFVFLILYLPIFYLIGYALNAGDDMNQFTGFSLTHFENLFGDKRLMLILAQTFFVTGNGFTTLSVEIYSRARQGISLEINALSALVFLFSILLVIGYYFISREKEEQA